MKVNLITNDNGVGLTRDMAIVGRLLLEMGHEVTKVHYNHPAPEADVSIWFEIVLNVANLKAARRNILIPNLEWFSKSWTIHLKSFDAIFCKTPDAFRFFRQFQNVRPVFTGFTSVDMFMAGVVKKRQFLHVYGKSKMKGTAQVIEAFKLMEDYPRLIVVGDGSYMPLCKDVENVKHCGRLDDDALMQLMNESLWHICTSEAEGWGHYIHESKSTGACILTTNAMPMSSFVSDDYSILIDVERKKPHNCGWLFRPKVQSIQRAYLEALAMSTEEAKEMGELAKSDFQMRDQIFRVKFMEHFNQIAWQ